MPKRKYSIRKLAIAASFCVTAASHSALFAGSPYATDLISATGYPASPGLYTDPSAALGKPTTRYTDPLTDDLYRTTLYSAAFNRDPANQSTLATVNIGQSIVVGFDHDVRNDPGNPYGVDLLVFGNSFFSASSSVTPTTDPRSISLTGGVNSEPLTVSVAQAATGPWYTFASPTGDGLFPTQADRWDSVNGVWGPESDFTKPVNPALGDAQFVGLSADQAIALYNGSGGGAGFDLAASGFDWIRYVRITGDGGEIDAVSDVAAVPEPGTTSLLALASIGLLARPRSKRE